MTFLTGPFLSILAGIFPYLDPGSGSILIQLLIAAVAALGLFVSVSWRKIRNLFGKREQSAPAGDDEDEDD